MREKGNFFVNNCRRKGTEVNSQSTSIVQTVPLCPSYVPNLSPLCAYQTLMMWSFEAEKRRSPSVLNLICVRERSCPTGYESRLEKPAKSSETMVFTDPAAELASTERD